MQHLTVSLGILALGMGIVSFMVVKRFYENLGSFFLKTYMRYLVVLNITVLINLIFHYLLVNVLVSIGDYQRVILIIIVNIIGFYLFSLLTFLYLILTNSLVDKKVGKTVKRLFGLIIILASMAYGFFTALYASKTIIEHIIWVHKIFISILLIISLVASVILFRNASTLKPKSRSRWVRVFGIIYALFFLYQIFLWFLPVSVVIILSAFNLFVYNTIPIFLVKNILEEQASLPLSKPGTRQKIERFYRKYGLSGREIEVANLIVAGKSNEEIEEELFISIFTVKKHISNIFMKLEIRSRSQLMRRIFDIAQSNNGDVN